MGYRWYHPPIDTSVCDVAWHRLEPVFLSSSGSGRNRSNQPANNQDKWIKINWYTRLLDTRATASCVSLKHTRARIESTVWVSNTLTSMHISSMSGKWCWWPTKCAQLAQFYRPLGKNSSTFALFHPVLNRNFPRFTQFTLIEDWAHSLTSYAETNSKTNILQMFVTDSKFRQIKCYLAMKDVKYLCNFWRRQRKWMRENSKILEFCRRTLWLCSEYVTDMPVTTEFTPK